MAFHTATGDARAARGFTLIELLVVMAIIATLLMIAMPRYFQSLERSRETVLKQDLAVMREAIDKFYGDLGRYPESLQELATRRYLRRVPVDPLTRSAESWLVVASENPEESGVRDVHSAAPGNAADGSAYADW
jgi:general secretion pathway protein G